MLPVHPNLSFVHSFSQFLAYVVAVPSLAACSFLEKPYSRVSILNDLFFREAPNQEEGVT